MTLRSAARMGMLSLAAGLVLALAQPATAQQSPEAPPSACDNAGVAKLDRSRLTRVRFEGRLQPDQVAITYVGHATFLIQTPGGLEIATDYADWLPPTFLPELITMNGAHSNHFSLSPPPQIAVALRGWSSDAGPAKHDVTRRDARVRNVLTDVQRGPNSVLPSANSIFIFEIGDLCIAHLGHLHVTPSGEMLSAIGQIDVLLAAVEGGPYMLSPSQVLETADRLGARVVIPMHYFSSDSLNFFIDKFRARYEIEFPSGSTKLFSKATLPAKPTLVILRSQQ